MRNRDQILLEDAMERVVNPKLKALKNVIPKLSEDYWIEKLRELTWPLITKVRNLILTKPYNIENILTAIEYLNTGPEALIWGTMETLDEEDPKKYKKIQSLLDKMNFEDQLLFLIKNGIFETSFDINTDVRDMIDNTITDYIEAKNENNTYDIEEFIATVNEIERFIQDN